MADEYISKQSFNDAIREAVRKYPNTFYNGLEVARQIAHDMNASDVAPVRHGRWIKSEIPDEKFVCSECGGACWYYDYEGEVAQSRYCPNCGARMDGGTN